MEKSKRGKANLKNGAYADKAQVLQAARQVFTMSSGKKDTKQLVNIITKCIYILLQGEPLAPDEATDLFFNITRLFENKDKDSALRKLTYIGIRALSKQAENVYAVTSSLTNDVSSSKEDPTIRASALRSLCQISDANSLNSLECHLKQSIVDKHSVLVSASLSSLMHIAQSNSEIIRKYSTEIQEALKSDSPMVQYQALGLYYKLFKSNTSELIELVKFFIKQQKLKSPLAICLLIRIVTEILNDCETNNNNIIGQDANICCNYIKNLLNHESTMVEYEAARAIINLKIISSESIEHKAAVSHLRNFLTSKKATLRFASVRSLNELAATSSNDIRFWSVHRIGGVCKLHLLNKRYKIGDHIIGIIDFSNSSLICAKYTVILQCEETQQYELKQEFSLGLKKNDFMITIPHLVNTKATILHCVLSFLFYIVDKNYPKTLFEDKAGTIELGPGEIDTKLFSCDFPIAIHCT